MTIVVLFVKLAKVCLRRLLIVELPLTLSQYVEHAGIRNDSMEVRHGRLFPASTIGRLVHDTRNLIVLSIISEGASNARGRCVDTLLRGLMCDLVGDVIELLALEHLVLAQALALNLRNERPLVAPKGCRH